MNKKEAKELSIKKWQIIVDDGGEESNLYDINSEEAFELAEKVENLKYGCPYCELFVKKDDEGCEYCDGCPIDLPKEEYNYTKNNTTGENKKVFLKGCCQNKHPWSIWTNNPCKETALDLLNFIKENDE